MNTPENVRYILYARKSSESDDRQMASIEDQIEVMKKFAESRGIIIHDNISEARSAKEPGRNGFQQLLRRIQSGEASGILCWKLNRLARNPVDGGQISWLLQQGIIKHIQTFDSSYHPTDNVILMQVEFGMANQFVNNLRVDVRRGMARKAKRGWYPAAYLPLGYMHNPKFQLGEDEIIPHPTQFEIVQKLWKKMISGNYTMPMLKTEADALGLVNKKGTYVGKNTLYKTFSNTFYFGQFRWKDENGEIIEIDGKHQPMITKVDFYRVRDILKGNGRTISSSKYDFLFRGLMKCGECGCTITVEQKTRTICTFCKKKFSIRTRTACPQCQTKLSEMDKPAVYVNTYYRCTKRVKACSQRYVNEKDLIPQILDKIENLKIHQTIVQALKKLIQEEAISQAKTKETASTQKLNAEIEKLKTQKSNLIDIRSANEITKEDFLEKSKMITEKINSLEARLESLNHISYLWKEESFKALDIAQNAFYLFQNGSPTEKKIIFNALGSNPYILDQKLYFSTNFLLLAFRSLVEEVFQKISRFEPQNFSEMAQESPYFPQYAFSGAYIIHWRAKLAEIRTQWIKEIVLKNKVNEEI